MTAITKRATAAVEPGEFDMIHLSNGALDRDFATRYPWVTYKSVSGVRSIAQHFTGT